MSDLTFNDTKDWSFPRTNQDSELLQQWGFVPGLQDFLKLRQVHALEHATVWVLSSLKNHQTQDDGTIGGLSTEKGFFLYGNINSWQLKQAVRLALTRLKKGEWNLAIHPRCGTNASVAALLTTGMVFTTHVILPKEPVTQVLGVGLASIAANFLAPELGMSVQKYLTTAIPFNLQIRDITQTIDQWGRPAHFIGLKWQNLQ